MNSIGITSIIAGLALFIILTLAAYTVVLERILSAWIQQRTGPNRVGSPASGKMMIAAKNSIFLRIINIGWLQPLADVIKLLLKEDIIPAGANRKVHFLAPVIAVTIALITMSVIPFARGVYIADVNIGVLFTLAATSIGVYGITLAGWSSNSKYSLLGGIRSSAQMISYELAMGIVVVSVILLTNFRMADGSNCLSLVNIVETQVQSGVWNVFINPIGFLIFMTCALAEANRSPFDLVEAEQELVGGFHTEYSSMKFANFFVAEYLHVIMGSMMVVTLFFGGYGGPAENILGVASWGSVGQIAWGLGWFAFKTFFFMCVYVWIRWTIPRFKYNQLMNIGWKSFLPLSLVNLVVIAFVLALIYAGK
ncbi:MAG: NADH-quinone oxidoreductase subunit H [Bacteroidia bacterium]|nr:NADH-quinone oxidoreductase subunit H [Bacteroidia bacterium]